MVTVATSHGKHGNHGKVIELFFGHGKSHGIPKIFQIVMEKSWKFFIKITIFFIIAMLFKLLFVV